MWTLRYLVYISRDFKWNEARSECTDVAKVTADTENVQCLASESGRGRKHVIRKIGFRYCSNKTILFA